MAPDPTAQSLKEQGNAKFQAKQYDEALKLYSKALQLDSNSAALYSNCSLCQLLLGQPQAALSDARKACQLRPDWEKGHFRKGAALEAMGKLEKALPAYRRALELNPTSKDIIKKVKEVQEQVRPAARTHWGGHGPDGPDGPDNSGPSGWSQGLSTEKRAEWLVDCYRIRLDDEYENKAMCGEFGRNGIKSRGLYEANPNFPEEAKSTIAEDFLIFCKLAVQRGVIPPGWDWALFLNTAARLLPHIFERPECTQKWGYEFVFHSPLLGRSLKHTAAIVYGESLLGTGMDGGKQFRKMSARLLGKWRELVEGGKKLGPQYFEDVGGVELWKKLHSDMVIQSLR